MHDVPGQRRGVHRLAARRLGPGAAVGVAGRGQPVRAAHGELHQPGAHRRHVRRGPREAGTESADYVLG